MLAEVLGFWTPYLVKLSIDLWGYGPEKKDGSASYSFGVATKHSGYGGEWGCGGIMSPSHGSENLCLHVTV